ncbi:ArsR/SmtB family transcription factor [Actinomadura pelletieri]|uniref:ArsR/SmtB family transcription factor n=1 Tax=Actinomadura pelletieri TaxID=111805 RepID=UPI000EB2C373|nr:ArsR family transcriptional regulator [Actinomadura pelletieri]
MRPDQHPVVVRPGCGSPSRKGRLDRLTAPILLGALADEPEARLLRLLEGPLATGELAHRSRVTPSAVSQYLRALFASGLVTRTRDGRRVLYDPSPLGDRLLDEPG